MLIGAAGQPTEEIVITVRYADKFRLKLQQTLACTHFRH